MKYFRVYLKGLHVGVGIRAEFVEVSGCTLFFWNGPARMAASFWLEDVERVDDRDGDGVMTVQQLTESLALSLAKPKGVAA